MTRSCMNASARTPLMCEPAQVVCMSGASDTTLGSPFSADCIHVWGKSMRKPDAAVENGAFRKYHSWIAFDNGASQMTC